MAIFNEETRFKVTNILRLIPLIPVADQNFKFVHFNYGRIRESHTSTIFLFRNLENTLFKYQESVNKI